MQKVALFPFHLCSFGRGRRSAGRIFLGKKKCFGRDIETKVVVQGMFASEGQGNGACTRADIDDEARGKIFKKLGGVLYEKFGFGARNQSGGGTLKS